MGEQTTKVRSYLCIDSYFRIKLFKAWTMFIKGIKRYEKLVLKLPKNVNIYWKKKLLFKNEAFACFLSFHLKKNLAVHIHIYLHTKDQTVKTILFLFLLNILTLFQIL